MPSNHAGSAIAARSRTTFSLAVCLTIQAKTHKLEPAHHKKTLSQNGYSQAPTAPCQDLVLLYPVMKVSCHFLQTFFSTFSVECVSELMRDILYMNSEPLALGFEQRSIGRVDSRGLGWPLGGLRMEPLSARSVPGFATGFPRSSDQQKKSLSLRGDSNCTRGDSVWTRSPRLNLCVSR